MTPHQNYQWLSTFMLKTFHKLFEYLKIFINYSVKNTKRSEALKIKKNELNNPN